MHATKRLVARDDALAVGSPLAPTLKDIAKRVGVSLNTVSRSIRAPNTVRAPLRRRIQSVLDEVNYVPNRLAGGLAGANTGVVAVIVTSLYNTEFAEVIEAMQAEFMAAGLDVMIGNSRYRPEEELRLVRSMLSWRPAAVAIVGTDHHPRVADMLAAAGRPVVEIWDCSDRVIDSGVGMDHRAIGALQVEHLYVQGCRRFAFVGAVQAHDARAQKRLEGAAQAVKRRRCRAIFVDTEPSLGSPEMGERLAYRLLRSAPDVDGVVCNSDVVAFGVLLGLKSAGKRIPRDVAVIGFGDNLASACVEPTLSSVRSPRMEIGVAAASLILRRIDGDPPARSLIVPSIVARASSLRVPST